MAEFMPIRQRKIYSVRSEINERNCKELLRFNSESVDFLAAQFLEESDSRGGGISRRQQMEIFLRFVGDPRFQSGVAQDVGVHRTTANKTIKYVMSRVVEQSHNWIRFPTTAEDMTEAKVLWPRHFRLPCVIGAVDCTQIEIQIESLGCTVMSIFVEKDILLEMSRQHAMHWNSLQVLVQSGPPVFTTAECGGIVMLETPCHSMMEQFVF
ncbi:hypothetical protein WA026_022368 [Henosepilachna vigintioctopunctata]|uniref:Transposase n=1 Tax=Henosepilachna vigintioctopunctata TaxID=420089 RepID=A0AAW1V3Q9_9CUCU